MRRLDLIIATHRQELFLKKISKKMDHTCFSLHDSQVTPRDMSPTMVFVAFSLIVFTENTIHKFDQIQCKLLGVVRSIWGFEKKVSPITFLSLKFISTPQAVNMATGFLWHAHKSQAVPETCGSVAPPAPLMVATTKARRTLRQSSVCLICLCLSFLPL